MACFFPRSRASIRFRTLASFLFFAGMTGLAQDASRPRLFYPWVSNNARFESLLVVNNLEGVALRIRLTARRATGEEETVERQLPAAGFLKANASTLFPSLGEGSGYSVTVTSDGANIAGRWITFQRLTVSGNSPAQAVAVDLAEIDAGTRVRLGRAVLYGYLPIDDDFFAAPVIVNLGETPANVHLYFYDQDGVLVEENHDLVNGLEPYLPYAVLVEDVLPGFRGALNLVAASEGNPLSGCSFVFNSNGEPAIGNVSGLDLDPGIARYDFPFDGGDQGFAGGFGDYPVGEETFYELVFGHESLPAPLATGRKALFLNGNNHGGDLFMYVKRKVGGLKPNAGYRVRFRIEIASNGPAGCSGVGGAPGDSVFFKAGASVFEPMAVDEAGQYLMNIDKGRQAQGGRAMEVLGTIGVETDCLAPEYKLKKFDNGDNLFELKTDPSGEVWIIAGTDSGFESTSRVYLSHIEATFFPVGGPLAKPN